MPDRVASRYPEFLFCLGVDEFGQRLEFNPAEGFAHILCVGGAGPGKAWLISDLIDQFLADSWRISIGDGNGAGHAKLEGQDGVAIVARNAEEHVRLVHEAVEEIEDRIATASERRRQGHPHPSLFQPLLIVLDEYSGTRASIASLLGKDQAAVYQSKFNRILKRGSQARVHMLVATEDLYAKTIPSDALDLFKLIISVGTPTSLTIAKAVPRALQEKACVLGERIRSKRGRGFIVQAEAGTISGLDFVPAGQRPRHQRDGPAVYCQSRAESN